ncbi:MOSC domain-containing protein [Candidatus Peribacteria bacterium]|nr:MOSC domain-containing protein [Candidatus Peribacteria bacterium]
MSSTPAEFVKELIQSVDKKGRQVYCDTVEDSPKVTGRKGRIAALNLRILKGITQLRLTEAMLTRYGLATADTKIFDCGAAIVRKVGGDWKRYSGKDSPHPTRIFSDYDSPSSAFSLWSQGDDGKTLTERKSFAASSLSPRKGDIVTAKFGVDTLLQGVLEGGAVTEHIRQCLSDFEDDVTNIGILLRHPAFHRASDTRNVPQSNIDTLYSDGAQIHAINRRTVVEWQNALMKQGEQKLRSYRAGIEIDGEAEMNPNVEDRVAEIDIRTQNDGTIPMNFASLTPRCLVTQRDVLTGAIRGEPKQWLKTYRPLRPKDGVATMGANVDVSPEYHGAIIRVGDRFTVSSEKTQWSQ